MNYQMIEYAVRRYIDEKKLFNGRKDYHLSIKTGGYIRGSFFAFVITDLSDDNRIYEVTSLTNSKSIAVTSYIQENADPFFV